MTEPLFFDTDCLSAFLWTDQGSIITRLYPGRVVIPQLVFDELDRVSTPAFKKRTAILSKHSAVTIRDIEITSPAFSLYREMTTHPQPGFKAVGRGEAAAMALAIIEHGIVASNNFRDTATYIRSYNLAYKTTGHILVDAYENALVTMEEANRIWAEMLAANRWLGAASFTEFYDKPIDPLRGF